MKESKYPHMFTPIRVGKLLLQNRFYTAPSKPHSIQGPEPFPTEATIRHYANKAMQGPAYVIVSGNLMQEPPHSVRGYNPNTQNGHLPSFDIADSLVQNYMSHLSDAIHFYGSKASYSMTAALDGYDVDDNVPPYVILGDGGAARAAETGKRISEKQMRELADSMAENACIIQDCGFDMLYMHCAYRLCLVSRFLSPRTNTRTDEFGGSIENRSRLLFMVTDRVKERCGKDFPIEVAFTGLDTEDPDPAKQWTLEDTKEFARLCEGHIDILQVRPHSVDYVGNLGFQPKLPTLEIAKAAKESGTKVLISSVSGYYHPEMAENSLKNGWLDLVGMSRLFICNPHWVEMTREGREDDIAPCIKCHRCHRNSFREPTTSVCSLNPVWGSENRDDYQRIPPKKSMNLAVVGGGPAGMRAALYAVGNGHHVTLFEKSGKLGGKLFVNEFIEFKWPLWEYAQWLQHQIDKHPEIDVRLNTEATPAMLSEGNYDEIITALGAEPVTPRIEGVDGKNVFYAVDVLGHPELVGDKLIVIGGGDIGVETALYFTRQFGKKAIVMEMREDLMLDATPVHYKKMFLDEWEKDANFSFICNAACTRITEKGVYYRDKDGAEHFVEADTVVHSVGMRPRQDDALAFYKPGERIHLIGDCAKPGNIQTCNRDAYRSINSL